MRTAAEILAIAGLAFVLVHIIQNYTPFLLSL